MQNRILASRSRLGTRVRPATELPEPVYFGDADRGVDLVGGCWSTSGFRLDLNGKSIWDIPLPVQRLEKERQSFGWLSDLAALGNSAARQLAQSWLQEWVAKYGNGSGPGWAPEIAGRRTRYWVSYCLLLTRNLDAPAADKFWRALASQQNYLSKTWPEADEGYPRLQALAGLVWSGLALHHPGHAGTVAELGGLAKLLINHDGEVAGRSPQELADIMILLIWTARVMENCGQQASPELLAAIVRGVPVLRPLRLGDGSLAMFQSGGPGEPDHLDKALAELRVGVQSRPKLAQGYARLAGGRVVAVMDAACPVASGLHARRSHASTLAFEMSVHRQPMVVNSGPGSLFGDHCAAESRKTDAHSTVSFAGQSSAQIISDDLHARTFGARLVGGPAQVTIRQAQDATGQWLLATHDGYEERFGVLHERRLFVDARGSELRGEDIISVPVLRSRKKFDRAMRKRKPDVVSRFHLHPSIVAEVDDVRQLIMLTLPSGEIWMFRTSGREMTVEPSVYYDPAAARPVETSQVVVRDELVEYLGQVIWSFSRIADAPTPD